MPTSKPPGNRGSSTVSALPSATPSGKDKPAPLAEVEAMTQALPDFAKQSLATAAAVIAKSTEPPYDRWFPELSDSQINDLIEGLEHYEAGIIQWMQPVTVTDVAFALAAFSDMLDVSVPGDAGIELYLAAMSNIPARLMPTAMHKVATTHRFARLPLPRDFLEAIAGELAWCEAKQAYAAGLRNQFTKARIKREQQRRRYPHD